jgi:hypothetical protein
MALAIQVAAVMQAKPAKAMKPYLSLHQWNLFLPLRP